MSQTESKYPTITIRQKDLEKPPVGANTEVLLNGEPIPFCSFVKVECHARRMTKIKMEMYAHVEIETMGELSTKIIELKQSK